MGIETATLTAIFAGVAAAGSVGALAMQKTPKAPQAAQVDTTQATTTAEQVDKDVKKRAAFRESLLDGSTSVLGSQDVGLRSTILGN